MNLNTIRNQLQWEGKSIDYLQQIDSTNEEAKRRIKSGLELSQSHLLLAGNQTAGKGRSGNVWKSSADKNILLSLIIFTQLPARILPRLSLVSALSICESLQRSCSRQILIKWPNDLIVEDKKLGGILIETISINSSVTALIIGVGINVFQNVDEINSGFDFPSVALINYLDHAETLSELVIQVVNPLHVAITDFSENKWSLYKSKLENKFWLKNKYINYNGSKMRVSGINSDGGLNIENESAKLSTIYGGHIRLWKPI